MTTFSVAKVAIKAIHVEQKRARSPLFIVAFIVAPNTHYKIVLNLAKICIVLCLSKFGKVAPNTHYKIVLNLAKICIVLCLSKFGNKKWGLPSSFLRYKHLKLKLRVFLAGHIVSMVACYIKRMTAAMIWHLYNAVIVASLL